MFTWLSAHYQLVFFSQTVYGAPDLCAIRQRAFRRLYTPPFGVNRSAKVRSLTPFKELR